MEYIKVDKGNSDLSIGKEIMISKILTEAAEKIEDINESTVSYNINGYGKKEMK